MKYYIVVNEWNYPTESGREIIGDYDTLEEAKAVAKEQYNNELANFLEVNKGAIYENACGEIVDQHLNFMGFILCSSQYETENMTFQSIIIEREI